MAMLSLSLDMILRQAEVVFVAENCTITTGLRVAVSCMKGGGATINHPRERRKSRLLSNPSMQTYCKHNYVSWAADHASHIANGSLG